MTLAYSPEHEDLRTSVRKFLGERASSEQLRATLESGAGFDRDLWKAMAQDLGLHGLAVVAYSPIARGGAQGDDVLARIGKAHGKSAAQVSLRFLVQQGIVVIPRTSKVERLEENIALFDFTLSELEMAEIRRLARRGDRIVDWTWSPKWD